MKKGKGMSWSPRCSTAVAVGVQFIANRIRKVHEINVFRVWMSISGLTSTNILEEGKMYGYMIINA